MRKTLCLLLSIVLLLSLMPVTQAASPKLVALTFDDGPGPYTARLLDGLAQRNAKVTFFMVGTNVKRYPETVKRIYREGHQVANHTYDHPELTSLSTAEVKEQVQSVNRLLDLACGTGTTYLLRAPYGSTNARVREAVGMPLIDWSVDPRDWESLNSAKVRDSILRNVKDGAIILVHDIHSTSVTGALEAIDALQDDGYEFVTVRELFRRRGVELKNGTTYSHCSPNGKDLGAVQKPKIEFQRIDGQDLVTITAQKGAEIYYSTDGSDLNQQSKRYTGPFTPPENCTLRAVASFHMNGSRSEEAVLHITRPQVKAPQLQVLEEMLTLQCDTEGAQIYYRLNDGSAQPYSEPVKVERETWISAWADCQDYRTSPVVTRLYSRQGNLFQDVKPTDWFYSSVDLAAARGYMKGIGNDVFAPEEALTRGMLVTLLYRYSGESAEGCKLPFRDVEPGRYYTEPIAWAYDRGVVHGYDAKTFKPEQRITRQEMCQVFANFLAYRQISVPSGAGEAKRYRDRDQIARWALPAVESMTACGMMQGNKDGTFAPLAYSTRAQAAALLIRLEKLEPPVEPTEPPTEPPVETTPIEPPVETEPTEPPTENP